MKSLGVIETRGLISAIQAADAACKAASVEIIGYRKIGSGLVSVCFQGEISAVRTAVDHGIEVIAKSQLLVGSLVIARPEESVITKLLTVKSKKGELEKHIDLPEKTPKSSVIEAKVDSIASSTATESHTKDNKSDSSKGKKS